VTSADGIVVPGGFGFARIEGKIAAARYARENNVPTWGCAWGCKRCASSLRATRWNRRRQLDEFDRSTKNAIIDLLPEQRDIADLGGTMRLGVYPCKLVPGTKADDAYDLPEGATANERHRHRFEFNNAYREPLSKAGLVYSGLSAGRQAGGDCRAGRPPLHGGHAVPSRVSEPAQPAAPAVSGLVAAVAARTPHQPALLPADRPSNGRAEPAKTKKAA